MASILQQIINYFSKVDLEDFSDKISATSLSKEYGT